MTNDARQRTIRIAMSGKFDAKIMRAWADEYRKLTDWYNGQPHLVLADMRGLTPNLPEVGHILGEAIGYARARGVACCVHISDDTVQRLQVARMARHASSGDDRTIDVSSLEEAEKVLIEKRRLLGSDRPVVR
ncbi:MAG TPA: hypothetical protein VK524_34915 [Polyangiaceae bacterium]|nr:hypothetical protein [Polyangiaceae bacterium]